MLCCGLRNRKSVALVGSGEEMFEADYSTTRLSQTSGKARRKHPIQGASVTTSASEMESIPPIDFAHLRRYTFGDEQLEREVLELFCIHAPGLLEEMKAATNPAAWREAAHSLKGSAWRWERCTLLVWPRKQKRWRRNTARQVQWLPGCKMRSSG